MKSNRKKVTRKLHLVVGVEVYENPAMVGDYTFFFNSGFQGEVQNS